MNTGDNTATAVQIPGQVIPRHVAIIMDGNNRWARRAGLPGVAGHRAGVEVVREVLEACNELGVSTENVHRLGMPDRWIHQDSRENQLAETGLDAAGIRRAIEQILRVPASASAKPGVDDKPVPARGVG